MTSADVWVDLEDGGRRDVRQVDHWVPPRIIDGHEVGEATYELPGDLPLGWHTLAASHDGHTVTAPLVVTPARLELPDALAGRRAFGLMTQLYSVRSRRSWGVGDLADLGELAGWAARDLGADFVLVNPLHAAEPVPPMEPSPYLPTTRRFVNPLYIRVEDIPEMGYVSAAERQLLEWHADDAHALNTDDVIDRDASWQAKSAALRIVFHLPRAPAARARVRGVRRARGAGPGRLRHLVRARREARAALGRLARGAAGPPQRRPCRRRARTWPTRSLFHQWLQWVVDEQLGAVQQDGAARRDGDRRRPRPGRRRAPRGRRRLGAARRARPAGQRRAPRRTRSTRWARTGASRRGGRTGSQELGYAPYRDMLRTVLRHAGGIRVDHVIGLFRLWWVPEGMTPDAGTYVRYDHEALIGILALEAHRAGALVVGEDLGVVEPWVRDYLRERGILGTSILWFEKDEQGRPLPAESYRELCLATVTTHDLPPTAGYLAGEHIDLREELGLLTRPVEQEREVDAAEQEAVLSMLRERGLLRPGGAEQRRGRGAAPVPHLDPGPADRGLACPT